QLPAVDESPAAVFRVQHARNRDRVQVEAARVVVADDDVLAGLIDRDGGLRLPARDFFLVFAFFAALRLVEAIVFVVDIDLLRGDAGACSARCTTMRLRIDTRNGRRGAFAHGGHLVLA